MRSSLNQAPRLVLIALAAFGFGCADGPQAPEGEAPQPFTIAPALSLVSTGNQRADDALSRAFDEVNRFRMVVRRLSTGEVLLSTVIQVTPGAEAYELSVEIQSVSPNEQLGITITAFNGEVELFASSEITLTANAAAGGGGAVEIDIPLSYSGPGATATDLNVAASRQVLNTTGTGTLSAVVRDAQGATLNGVPVIYSSLTPAIVTVTGAGAYTAVGSGIAELVATIPSGAAASTHVFVVDGEIAYVVGGAVFRQSVGGGTPTSLGSFDGATGLSWNRDGTSLWLTDAGQVRSATTGRFLTPGSMPSASPDGTKLAFERNGQVYFMNVDGTNVTPGPSGTAPQWLDSGEDLVVGGGSIQQVRADGENRSTLIQGTARLPIRSATGRMAWLRDQMLVVDGADVLAGVNSRPSWSPDGAFLVASTADGLILIDASGSVPPASLGIPGAWPAWRPQQNNVPGPDVTIGGFNPEEPTPSMSADILGSGFDWIIPRNVSVFFTGPDGEIAAEVLAVNRDKVRVVIPGRVIKGPVRVQTRTSSATIDFDPKLFGVEIKAATAWAAAVEGVGARLLQGATVLATGTSGRDGTVSLSGVRPGTYTLELTAPFGFVLGHAARSEITVAETPLTVPVLLRPLVASATLTPERPRIAMGVPADASVAFFDVNGNPIPELGSVTWAAGNGAIAPAGTRLNAILRAVYPTASGSPGTFVVTADGTRFTFEADVTSNISGQITGTLPAGQVAALKIAGAPVAAQNAEPIPGIQVELRRGNTVVETVVTNGGGLFNFDGLIAGNYTVVTTPTKIFVVSPSQHTIDLGPNNPVGRFAFNARPRGDVGRRGDGDVVIYKDYSPWFFDSKNEAALQAAPFGLTAGAGYQVRHTSELKAGIPATTSLIILGSASNGSSPVGNVNDPAAQAALQAFVMNGGWLVAHVGDNVSNDGFLIPGMLGKADDQNPSGTREDGKSFCRTMNLVAPADHPFVAGPDKVVGTGDDLTEDNVDMVTSCSITHGSLEGILPGNAEILLREERSPTDGARPGRPVYATYTYGQGRVVVGTLTFEFRYHRAQVLMNHLWWTVNSGRPAGALVPWTGTNFTLPGVGANNALRIEGPRSDQVPGRQGGDPSPDPEDSVPALFPSLRDELDPSPWSLLPLN